MKLFMISSICCLSLLVFGAFITNTDESDKLRFEISTVNYETGTNLGGVKVEFFKEGKSEAVYITNRAGKIPEVEVSINYQYRIIFSKEGFLKRSFVLNAKNTPGTERYTKGWDVPFRMDMVEKSRLLECSDDIAFLENCDMTTLRYNPKSGDLDYSTDTLMQMKRIIAKCIKK